MAHSTKTLREHAVEKILADLGRRSVFEIRSTLTPLVSLDCENLDIVLLNAKLYEGRRVDLSKCTEFELQLSPEQEAIAYQGSERFNAWHTRRMGMPLASARYPLHWQDWLHFVLGNVSPAGESSAIATAEFIATLRSWSHTTRRFANILFKAVNLYKQQIFHGKRWLLLDLLLVVLNTELDEDWLNKQENAYTAYINHISPAQWFYVAREICSYSMASDLIPVHLPNRSISLPKLSGTDNPFKHPAHQDRSRLARLESSIGRIEDTVVFQKGSREPKGSINDGMLTAELSFHTRPNLGMYIPILKFFESAYMESPHTIAKMDYRYRIRIVVLATERRLEQDTSTEQRWDAAHSMMRLANGEYIPLQQLREVFKQYKIFWKLDDVPPLGCYNTNAEVQPSGT